MLFNCDVTSCPLKKQTAAVMKWRNYFCDDIMSDANLQDRTFPHSASSCKLYQRILGTFWSRYIYIFLACQSNLTSAHVTVKELQMCLITILTFFVMCTVCQISCFHRTVTPEFPHYTWCGRKVTRLAMLCTNRKRCSALHMAVRLTPAIDSVQVWTCYSCYVQVWTCYNCYAIVESIWSEVVCEVRYENGPAKVWATLCHQILYKAWRIRYFDSEINPTRCNNCVYSSQWLYSTCFRWQFHPSSGFFFFTYAVYGLR